MALVESSGENSRRLLPTIVAQKNREMNDHCLLKWPTILSISMHFLEQSLFHRGRDVRPNNGIALKRGVVVLYERNT
jgi:hypothetical protein